MWGSTIGSVGRLWDDVASMQSRSAVAQGSKIWGCALHSVIDAGPNNQQNRQNRQNRTRPASVQRLYCDPKIYTTPLASVNRNSN